MENEGIKGDADGITISITIDVRERELIEALSDSQVAHSVRALDMGDILVKCERASGAQAWAFERKTMADLASSIKDGRYREQKARLLAHFPPHRITYVLEGAPCASKWCAGGGGGGAGAGAGAGLAGGRLSAGTLQGFVFNTLYRDGIHVVFVQDVEDTAAFVAAFAGKLATNPGAFSGAGATGAAACTQEDAMLVKSRPGANVTPDLCWRLMLSQIPGISGKLSTEIVKVWPRMAAFVRELEPLDAKARLSKLKAVPLLGPKKGAVICAYVFQDQ